MAIQAISFGNNNTPKAAKTKAEGKKKMTPVGKGALIGAGVGVTINAVNYFTNPLVKDAVKMIGKGPYAVGVAFAAGFYALIGAGIGKLVKNHQENKQMEKEAEERETSKALDKTA